MRRIIVTTGGRLCERARRDDCNEAYGDRVDAVSSHGQKATGEPHHSTSGLERFIVADHEVSRTLGLAHAGGGGGGLSNIPALVYRRAGVNLQAPTNAKSDIAGASLAQRYGADDRARTFRRIPRARRLARRAGRGGPFFGPRRDPGHKGVLTHKLSLFVVLGPLPVRWRPRAPFLPVRRALSNSTGLFSPKPSSSQPTKRAPPVSRGSV